MQSPSINKRLSAALSADAFTGLKRLPVPQAAFILYFSPDEEGLW